MTTATSTAVTVAENICRLRERAGLSVHELARRSGIDASAWCRWQLCQRVPTLDTLDTIAAALNVSVAELVSPGL